MGFLVQIYLIFHSLRLPAGRVGICIYTYMDICIFDLLTCVYMYIYVCTHERIGRVRGVLCHAFSVHHSYLYVWLSVLSCLYIVCILSFV